MDPVDPSKAILCFLTKVRRRYNSLRIDGLAVAPKFEFENFGVAAVGQHFRIGSDDTAPFYSLSFGY